MFGISIATVRDTDLLNINQLFGQAKAVKDAQNTKAQIIVVDDITRLRIYYQNLANTSQRRLNFLSIYTVP